MRRFAVVMAGGIGSRLWPLSTRSRPKQFIQIEKGRTFIETSIKRLEGIVSLNNCYVVTNTEHEGIMTETLNGIIHPSNIIYEPLRKNTCACITYSALLLKKKYDAGIICYIPSDSFISDTEKYKNALERAFDVAEKYSQMVVIGVRPSFPCTEYGYFKADELVVDGNSCIKIVREFTEKPNYNKAEEYISLGQYFWNCGILVSNIDILLENIKSYMPELFQSLLDIVDKISDNNFEEELARVYGEIESISFDYGVLEKNKDLLAIEGEFDWSDIGSLQTLSKYFYYDISSGNAVKGEHVGVDTRNSIIYSEHGLVATMGLDNVVIVNTGKVILVCPKEKVSKIDSLVDELKGNGFEKYL